MEKIGIRVMEFRENELITAWASITTVLERCGEAMRADDPVKHGLLVITADKLNKLIHSHQERAIAVTG